MALQCKRFILLILLQLSLRRGAAQSESNIALGKPAWQSTTSRAGNQIESLEASRANDGVKEIYNETDRRYSHTSPTQNSWWYVNLQGLYYITKIVLYNLGGNRNSRLNNVSILTSISDSEINPSLSSALWIQRFYQHVAFDDIGTIELSPAAPAIYLAVFSNGTDGVVLREVEVYGSRAMEYYNLALGKTAYQSSDMNVTLFPASRAVNGIKDDFTHTAPSFVKWWKVDLGQLSLVESVTVYNRHDDWLYYKLRMFSILTSITGTPSFLSPDWIICRRVEQQVNASIFAPCNRVLARFVAIYSNYRYRGPEGDNDNVLSLAEVEVNGTAMLGVEELQLSSINKSCLSITWEHSSHFVPPLDYQFRCGNTEWKSTTELSGVSCLERPSDQVTCSVRSGLQGQYGLETAGTVTTSCSACAESPGIKLTDDSEWTALNIGLIVGVLLASMVCVVLLVLGLLYHRRRKAKMNKILKAIVPSGDKHVSESDVNNTCNSFTQNRIATNQKGMKRDQRKASQSLVDNLQMFANMAQGTGVQDGELSSLVTIDLATEQENEYECVGDSSGHKDHSYETLQQNEADATL